MTKVLSSILTKLYWPIIGIFGFVLVVYVFLYFYQIDNWSDRSYYHWMNAKRISIIVGILAGSIYMKYQGNILWAHIILYVPVALLLIGALILLFILYLYTKSS
jgi:hypothetical protein